MFVVSFHEQSQRFDLHKANGNKFEIYRMHEYENNPTKGAERVPPLSSVVIYGYLSKHNKNITDYVNIYYGDHFAITEVEDNKCEHLFAEHGASNSYFINDVIFVEKTQLSALNKAKAKLKEKGLNNIPTGSRPLEINDALKIHNFPDPKKLSFIDMIN